MHKMHTYGYWILVPHSTWPPTSNGFRTIPLEPMAPRRREDQQWSKSENSCSSDFCNHNRKTGHKVFDSSSIKRKENGRPYSRTKGQYDLNCSPTGNQINVAESRSGEILFLEESLVDDSVIKEVLYNAQDAHTWLLDSGATFHMTPNIEWFSNYSAGANGTIQLGNWMSA